MDDTKVSDLNSDGAKTEVFRKKSVNKKRKRKKCLRLRWASRILSQNPQHEGLFVAWSSFNDRMPIATGLTRAEVKKKAEINGCPQAVISYIPTKLDMLSI